MTVLHDLKETSMTRRLLVEPLCVAAALLGLFSATTAEAASTPTIVAMVNPVDQYQVLKPSWTVLHRFYGGTCNEGSGAGIPGADRCFVSNTIYDPCWPTVNQYDRYNGSFCPSAPWSHSGILIKGHHHPYNDATGRSVWGIALPSGNRCSFVGGAGTLYRGKRVNFGCQHDSIWLVGRPNKTTRIWHILAVQYDKNFRVVRHWTAEIRRAWVARSPYGG